MNAFRAVRKLYNSTLLLNAIPDLMIRKFGEQMGLTIDRLLMEGLMNTVGRDIWGFVFSAKAIRAGALKQAKHHRRRIAFWKKEKVKAEKRATKITKRKVQMSGGYREERAVDGRAINRLGEAETKLESHEASAKNYERWAKLLAKRPTQGFDVTLNDAVYFGLV